MNKQSENILGLKQIKLSRDKISIYRNLISDKVINSFYKLLTSIESPDVGISRGP